MKCEGVNCNQQPKSAYSTTKKAAGLGALVSLAAQGAAYTVVNSCLWGLKGDEAKVDSFTRAASEEFGTATKDASEKFVKDLLKDMRKPDMILRSAFKFAAFGAIIGLAIDSYKNYSMSMDYRKE